MSSNSLYYTKNNVVSIQYLRGLAALMVCAAHILHIVFTDFHFPKFRTFFLASGVDLFFILSGFIIFISSDRYYAVRGAWKSFLAKRAVRIIPLYWIVTSLFTLYLIAGHKGELSWVHLFLSYLFIPYDSGIGVTGMVFPVYGIGWTLNYEMFFYSIFSIFLFLSSREAALGTIAVILAVCLWGAAVQDPPSSFAFWSRPIVIEFCLGITIGVLYKEGVTFPSWMLNALGLAALSFLVLGPLDPLFELDGGLPLNSYYRVLQWGVPMAVLTAAAVLRRDKSEYTVASLKFLGDISYSLYLWHPLVIVGSNVVSQRISGKTFEGGLMFIAVSSAMSLFISHASYRWIEMPSMNAIKRVRKVSFDSRVPIKR